MGSKYQPLFDFFAKCTEENFKLTFKEIEAILGFELAPSYKNDRANWSNNKIEIMAKIGWLPNGYMSYNVDVTQGYVWFKKGKPNLHGPRANNKQIAKTSNRPPKVVVPKPCKNEVDFWLKEWNNPKNNNYVAQEKALEELYCVKYPTNKDLTSVLIKCSVLNDFYSTNIFKVYQVACHIVDLDIDERLKKGDVTLVKEIEEVKFEEKNKYFYSFASKYCSHHNPKDFPIYDYYVDIMLTYFKRVDNFYNFEKEDLKDYEKFKTILIAFRAFYGLTEYSLKDLDKYLWQVGKKYFPKNYKKSKRNTNKQ